MTNENIRSAMMYYAAVQVELEYNERLSETPLYRKKLKSLMTNLQTANEVTSEKFYKGLEGPAELQFNTCVKAVELFMECLDTKGIEVVTELLLHLRCGGIAVMAENQHKKIIKQLPTL
tara:strand:- start:33 stop:389 length:357 start_codon:yes stop_codon:yes gene_type:complete